MALNRNSYVELKNFATLEEIENEEISKEIIFVKKAYRAFFFILIIGYMVAAAFLVLFSVTSTALPIYFQIPGTKYVMKV